MLQATSEFRSSAPPVVVYNHPLKDVAEAGGWKDVNTLLTGYAAADEETLLR